jgi:hypothetical protein
VFPWEAGNSMNYTIDLSEMNAAGRLRKALDPYLTVASRVGRTTTRPDAAETSSRSPPEKPLSKM